MPSTFLKNKVGKKTKSKFQYGGNTKEQIEAKLNEERETIKEAIKIDRTIDRTDEKSFVRSFIQKWESGDEWSKLGIKKSDRDKMVNCLQTNKAAKALLNLKKPNNKIEKYTINIDPISRPSGYFVIKGRATK